MDGVKGKLLQALIENLKDLLEVNYDLQTAIYFDILCNSNTSDTVCQTDKIAVHVYHVNLCVSQTIYGYISNAHVQLTD